MDGVCLITLYKSQCLCFGIGIPYRVKRSPFPHKPRRTRKEGLCLFYAITGVIV